MLVLSSICSSSPPLLELCKQQDRVSSSQSTSSSSSSSCYSFSGVALRRRYGGGSLSSINNGGLSKSKRCLVLCCSSKLKVMTDTAPKLQLMADDVPVKAEMQQLGLETDSESDSEQRVLVSPSFADIRSGQELLSRLKEESKYGRLSENVVVALQELYQNYSNAVLSSGDPHADEISSSNMSAMLDCVLLDEKDPFMFPAHHKAIREPFDYYTFGQNYIRPLVDFGSSYVGNIALFQEIEEKLQQGHNIILMSNHQTEADPAIIALHLERSNSLIAENLIYVAGDRVVTDPLCKPFSMGRNLLCVYSKKHMHDDPKLVDMKKRANTRSLKEMVMLLRAGSQIIWIAPSGGRDRPDPATNEWSPAPFDTSAVDNMKRLVEHAGVPGHIYPLAILCYDIMPPPAQVEKEIGEKRVMSFHGTGVSVAPEINYHDISLRCKNEEEMRSAFAKAMYDSVSEQYKVLTAAVHGKQGLGASTPAVSLSQPWRSC